MDFSVAERIILAALAYSAKFDFPLTRQEIVDRAFKPELLSLLGEKPSSRELSKKELLSSLESLVKKGKVTKQGKFYSLSSAKTQTIKINSSVKKFKAEVVEELVEFASKIPWVLGVVLTGSYAAGVIKEKDDLDFLIITKRNRLWLTRLIFLFTSSRKGRRPHLPKGDLSHSWDFNFWLDESRLAMPKEKRDIYEAYEILQTKWVVNKENIRERFFDKNFWVNDYFLFSSFPTKKTKKKRFFPDLLIPLEHSLFVFQILYRSIRHGWQKADLHSAFFHSTSTKNSIINGWRKEYKKILDSKKVLVTGVFDVLHQEHKKFLKAAKKEGTHLIIGIESDKRVKVIKGVSRPTINQEQRKKNLEKLEIADEVFILPENFKSHISHIKLIEKIKPDVLAVSSHTAHLNKKRAIMKANGGIVKVVLKHNPKVSSTKIINGS